MKLARMSRKTLVYLLVICFLAAGASPATALAQAPDTVKVTIVSSNDLHGALSGKASTHYYYSGGVKIYDNWGGLDWLAGYINVVREENPDGTLWLDAGDAMQGTLASNYFYGESTINILNTVGVDAMAVGNHEFDWGQAVLQARSDQADFPFLAANIFYAKKNGNLDHGHGGRPHWAKPYKILEANNVKIGVIGIANPETPSLTNPNNVSDLLFTDPVQAVNDVLPEVQAEGATVVVVLAHIGGYYPDFAGLSEFVCGLDPQQVDLVVSGHTHNRIDDVICSIPVVQSYSSGTAFSRVDFTVDVATGQAINYNMNSKPADVYQTYSGNPPKYTRWDNGQAVVVVPDPAAKELVDYYNAQIEALKNEVIGETTASITRNYRYESSMGDWVTDIMKAYDPGIDFAFTNSGGLRADMNTGPITFGEVFDVMPFDNTTVIVDLTGAEVIQVLKEGTTGQHGLIQVSGLKFAFDYGTVAVGDSTLVGDVIDLSTGLPLDPTHTYRVAVNDFMASGGDHYGTLPGKPQINTYVLIRDLMVDWVKANSPFTPPDPVVEQRITITGTPPP